MQDFSINSSVVKTENNNALSETDVIKSIKSQAAKKAPGRDGIPSEAWQYVEDKIKDTKLKIMKKIWNNNKIPTEWTSGAIAALYKKED